MIALLWDLDGTLVDSAPDIAAAVDHTLQSHGHAPLGEARVRRHIGHGARNLVASCLGEATGAPPEPARVDRLLAHFLQRYQAHVADRTVVHPPELRGFLEAWPAPMAVVTNKPYALTVALLRALDLARHFPVVLGGDSLPTRKPDPGMILEAMRRLGVREAVLVGDGDADVAAGHAAGLPVLGVRWGIGRPDGADLEIDSVAELGPAVARLAAKLYR